MKVKSIFISDIHLGTKFAKSEQLKQFLKKYYKNPPENIFLVGDIIDGWQLRRKKFYGDSSTNMLIRKLLGFAKKGTKIYWIIGNHDEFMREFIRNDISIGNITISNEMVYESHGRRYLITHGDKYDLIVKYTKWIAIAGDIGYTILLNINEINNWFRRIFRMKQFSLSKYIKHKVKEAANFMNKYEETLVGVAESKGLDGVICGHIHHPTIKDFDGTMYMNDGDWVESMSALVEYEDGTFELKYYLENKK